MGTIMRTEGNRNIRKTIPVKFLSFKQNLVGKKESFVKGIFAYRDFSSDIVSIRNFYYGKQKNLVLEKNPLNLCLRLLVKTIYLIVLTLLSLYYIN